VSDDATPRPLWQQGLGYGLVGGAQLALDWLVFFLLTSVGLAVVPANVAGRIAGAATGFWLNGTLTFRHGGRARLGWKRLGRFVVAWSVFTVLGTLAVALVDREAGLHVAWIAKPAIDVVLAGLGFLASRYWIYR
jgi:putative flippase GtrA